MGATIDATSSGPAKRRNERPPERSAGAATLCAANAATEAANTSEQPLAVGAWVKACYHAHEKPRNKQGWGAGHYYPGTVVAVNSDGTYGVRYDDGDVEDRVERRHIQQSPLSTRPAPPTAVSGAESGARSDARRLKREEGELRQRLLTERDAALDEVATLRQRLEAAEAACRRLEGTHRQQRAVPSAQGQRLTLGAPCQAPHMECEGRVHAMLEEALDKALAQATRLRQSARTPTADEAHASCERATFGQQRGRAE